MSARLLLPALGIGLALSAFVAFRLLGDDSTPAPGNEVTGYIVDVTEGEPGAVAGFVLLTADGASLTFAVASDATDGDGGPVTYGHVILDATLGQETLVRYREEGGTKVAVVVGHPRGH